MLDEHETLIADCDGILFLGTSAQETLNYISAQLGYMTVTSKSRGRSRGSKSGSTGNWQQTKREVMSAEELGRMSNEQCIVFTRGERPIQTRKYQGVMHPLWSKTGGKNIFQFTKMKIYDNRNEKDLSCLQIAWSECIRFKKEIIKT